MLQLMAELVSVITYTQIWVQCSHLFCI